ncbi:MAG: hypothetical protein ACRD0P_28400, partial [Stackebrandtia sp.]
GRPTTGTGISRIRTDLLRPVTDTERLGHGPGGGERIQAFGVDDMVGGTRLRGFITTAGWSGSAENLSRRTDGPACDGETQRRPACDDLPQQFSGRG